MKQRFQCKECDKNYSHYSYLLIHSRVHEGEIFPCPDCDYIGKYKQNLKIHIKSIHKDEKFQCQECEFKARANSTLKIHVKSIHRGETFPCPECDYKSGSRGRLQAHINSIHKGKTLSVQSVITQQDGKVI